MTGHEFIASARQSKWIAKQAVGALLLWQAQDATRGASENSAIKLPYLVNPKNLLDSRNGGAANDLRYSPNGRYLMAASRGSSSLGVWDFADNRWISRKFGYIADSQATYQPIGFSNDSTLYFYAKQRIIYPKQHGAEKQNFEESIDGTICPTDIVAERVVDGSNAFTTANIFKDGQYAEPFRLLSDGETFACLKHRGGPVSFSGTETLEILPLKGGPPLQSWEIKEWLQDFSCSLDGRQFATTGEHNGEIMIFRRGVAEPIVLDIPNHDSISHSAFSPDGSLFAACGWGGDVFLWDARNLTFRKTLYGFDEWNQSATFSPDSKTLATVNGKVVKFWRM